MRRLAVHWRLNLTNADHEGFMRRAIELSARAALEYGTGGPFGAVVVKDNTIVAEGMNRVVASHDPTWHGEMEAIRLACITLQSSKLTGCTLYTTCEPCPMCMANALWAKLDRIVFGATIADANRHCLQIHIAAKEVAERADMTCVVEGPVLRELCYTLFTHPNMLKAFRTWSSRKEATGKA